MGTQVVDVVTLASLLTSSLLDGLRGYCSGSRNCSLGGICDGMAGTSLRLWGIINDNDLLGETIAVEIVPIGLAGTTAFS